MYSLYLTSISGEQTNDCKTIVRVGFLGHQITATETYYFKNRGSDQAKLIAAAAFFYRAILSLEIESGADLTIYLDSDELFSDFECIVKDQFLQAKHLKKWKTLMEMVNALRLRVSFKAEGTLSATMREELQQEIKALQVTRETL